MALRVAQRHPPILRQSGMCVRACLNTDAEGGSHGRWHTRPHAVFTDAQEWADSGCPCLMVWAIPHGAHTRAGAQYTVCGWQGRHHDGSVYDLCVCVFGIWAGAGQGASVRAQLLRVQPEELGQGPTAGVLLMVFSRGAR